MATTKCNAQYHLASLHRPDTGQSRKKNRWQLVANAPLDFADWRIGLKRAIEKNFHLEIGLPDEKGRNQIFDIHTKKMRDNQLIDKDVNIEKLAKLTKNYTGAEI